MAEGVDLVQDGDYLNMMFVDDRWYTRYSESQKNRTIRDLSTHAIPTDQPIGARAYFDSADVGKEPFNVVVAAMVDAGVDFTLVDIGAHYGVTSMNTARLMRRFGASRPIHAFDGGRAGLLTQCNLDNNGFGEVTFHQAAVGPIDGHAVMYFHAGHSDDNALISRQGVGVPVRVVKLDTVLEKAGSFGPVCAKIDVQGAEPYVLMGMKRLVAAHPVVVFMEYTPHAIKQGGADPIAFLRGVAETHHIFDTWRGSLTEIEADGVSAFRTEISHRPRIWTDLLLVPRNLSIIGGVLDRLRSVRSDPVRA